MSTQPSACETIENIALITVDNQKMVTKKAT